MLIDIYLKVFNKSIKKNKNSVIILQQWLKKISKKSLKKPLVQQLSVIENDYVVNFVLIIIVGVL